MVGSGSRVSAGGAWGTQIGMLGACRYEEGERARRGLQNQIPLRGEVRPASDAYSWSSRTGPASTAV